MKRLIGLLWAFSVCAHAFVILPQGHTPQQGSQTRIFTIASQTSSGLIAWSNPGNAEITDGVYATVAGSGSVQSETLELSSAPFSIPSAAQITGIKAIVTRHYSGAETSISGTITLVQAGGALSSAKTDSVAWLTTDDSINSGSSTDLWGVSWVPGNVDGSGFGVDYQVTGTGWSSTTAYIDSIIVTVYYKI